MSFVSRVIVSAIALWVVNWFNIGLHVYTNGSGTLKTLGTYLVIALVLTAVNLVVKPVARFVAFPLYVITLGLFGLVINALMLLLASWLTSKQHLSFGLHLDNFSSAFWSGLVLSILSALIAIPFKRHHRNQQERRMAERYRGYDVR